MRVFEGKKGDFENAYSISEILKIFFSKRARRTSRDGFWRQDRQAFAESHALVY
jgi:hypothetical protein